MWPWSPALIASTHLGTALGDGNPSPPREAQAEGWCRGCIVYNGCRAVELYSAVEAVEPTRP